MLEGINEPVVFPVGGNNYCTMVLNLQHYARRGFVGYTANWDEIEVTTTVKADYTKRYPTFTESTKATLWAFNPTTNQRTGVIYALDYQDRPARFNNWRSPRGFRVEIANAYSEGYGTYAWAITGRESDVYSYIANEMNKPWGGTGVGGPLFWSNTLIGINKFTVSDGICYLPDRTTRPPLALQPPASQIYLGNAAPPPPPPKNMCGCDCNTIATIIEERLVGQNKPIKDHIDQRTIEQLKAVNKMLQGMKIDLDLQPVIDRINEVEANLWNGPQGE